VSSKLRQKVIDYIQGEEDKKKVKVNEEELKYQFVKETITPKKVEEEPKGKPSSSPPPLPGQKRKDDKVMETLHNDKNISKKIERASSIKKSSGKSTQNTNTEVTIPPQEAKKGGKQGG
jgi:hypothetical protein